ncbi:type VI lipase adapter Tla3 domain-containing protein, partial [Pseudomonas avellanae]|uniref:type VI lipase adapter Tla3 domain-containing protein n=1 Tax=Pseudomonas avellanae TaxID=46257 RepID=UPI0004A48355
MRERRQKKSLRPGLKPYLWIAAILLTFWIGFVLLVYIKAQETNMELRDMSSVMRWGITAILGATLLAFSGHWWGKAVAHEKAELADYKNQVMVQNAEQHATQQRTYSLEIRGVGVGIYHDHQTEIWEFVKKNNNNFVSIYSRDPKDYDASVDSREISRDLKTRVAFQHSAGASVAYWPIPTFALAPPKQPSDTGAADSILTGRNAATLGVTLFLWQEADNTTHAQRMIEHLFQFFDDNPKLPQALIVSEDGDVTRDGLRVAGTPGLQNIQAVPTVFESMTGLLVTRSDRVDRYIRPYATQEPENNQNKNTDLVYCFRKNQLLTNVKFK